MVNNLTDAFVNDWKDNENIVKDLDKGGFLEIPR